VRPPSAESRWAGADRERGPQLLLHHGFDLRGIARAALSFFRFKGLQAGAR